MNEKIKKYKADYENNEKRISVLQEKSKKLLAKIRQLENEEIIGLVRESNLDIEALSRLLKKNSKEPTIFKDKEPTIFKDKEPTIFKDLEEKGDEIKN